MKTRSVREELVEHALVLIRRRGFNGFSYRDLAELVQRKEGRETVVSAKEVTIPLEGDLKLELEIVRNIVEVQLQDEFEYSVTLDEAVPEGRIGVYVSPGGSAKYESLSIERDTP